MSAELPAVLQVQLYGYRLRVTGPAPAIDPLKPVFFSRCQEPPATPADDVLEIRLGDSGYEVRREGAGSGPLLETEYGSEVFWWLDEWFFEHALERADDCLQLHAAAAALDGRAILFVGGSHTGKTSLTLQLVLCGYQYMTDEAVVVHPATLRLRPFPRNLMVREGSVQEDPALKGFCRGHPEYLLDDEGEPRWFLDPALFGGAEIPEAADVSGIVCLEKRESGPPLMEEIGARAAVEAMVKQQGNLRWHGAPAGLDTMIRLAGLGRNYRLGAVHPGEAWGVLQERLGLVRCWGGSKG